jgi:membrane protein implicated in regulation of membrane protease activity
LWPVASAVACGAITALIRLDIGLELGLFVVLTIGSTLLARRYFPPGKARPLPSSDNKINGLIGLEGMVVEVFTNGHGVVLVRGQEWPAEADRQRPLDLGAAIRVELAIDGVRLRVCEV